MLPTPRRRPRRSATLNLSLAAGLTLAGCVLLAPEAALSQPAAAPSEEAAGPGVQAAESPKPPAGRGRSLPPIRPMRVLGLAADIAAILLSGQEGGDLPVAVLSAPIGSADGSVRVPLSMEIDVGMLFDFSSAEASLDEDSAIGEESPPERLEIFAYALGEDGKSIQDTLIQAFDLDVERLSESRRGFRYAAELTLPKPPGTVRVLARLQQREALAVRTLQVAAAAEPAAGTAEAGGEASAALDLTIQPRLSPPLVAGGEGWLELPRLTAEGRKLERPAIFSPRKGPPPAGRAVIVRGEPLPFAMRAEGLEATSSAWTVELLAGDGRLSAEAGAELLDYAAPDEGGARRLEAIADTANLPLGSFDLRAVLPAAGAGAEPYRSATLPVLVIDASQASPETAEAAAGSAEPPRPEAWPWLVARLTAPDAPRLTAAAAAPPGGAPVVPSRMLREGLKEVYAHLAGGRDAAARSRHVLLASEIADRYGALGLKALAKAEYERARAFAGLSALEGTAAKKAAALSQAEYPQAVLPIAALHFDLYREARRLRRTLISTHARFMTLRLVELFIKVSPDREAAQRTAATLLVSLGGELQLADMVYFSERMFRKALSMDAEQTTALLALGMNYQLIGDGQRARDAFSALLEQDPENAEARLRLARLELVEGQRRGAQRLFEKAARGPGPPWARAVAFQELARLEIDRGRLEEAEALLEEALGAFPEETRIRLLLAFVHDASQNPDSARRFLDRTSADDWPQRPSARRRFGAWSRESFVRNDSRLQEQVERAQPVFLSRWQDVDGVRRLDR
ncbi:MAG: tetratricopeptide repeat protein [Acidobacteriota bacterium]